MKRHYVSKSKSKRMFKRSSNKTKAINVLGSPRGGYRL